MAAVARFRAAAHARRLAPPSSGAPGRHPSHSPAAAPRASPASPLFGRFPPTPAPITPPPNTHLLPPVQATEPGSGCGRPAKRTRGRAKCFRGNGPGVGVCKLASVPARAGGGGRGAWHGAPEAWRRRRAAESGRREAAPGRCLGQTWSFTDRIHLGKPRPLDSGFFFRQQAEVT